MSPQAPVYEQPAQSDESMDVPQALPVAAAYTIGQEVVAKYPTGELYEATILASGSPEIGGSNIWEVEWADGDTEHTLVREEDIHPREQTTMLGKRKTVSARKKEKQAKKVKTGARVIIRETAESGYKFIGPRSYGCALQCFEVICHALGCPETAQYLDKSFAKRAKSAQLDMTAIGRKLTDANNETGVRLNMVREPPEHEVPLDERKGGPLLYALNQLGVFILVTSPVPATVINGVQINHAVVYVKLGNTNGATGTQRGLWMDPHKMERRLQRHF
jgi:hypothetical protein